MKVGDMWMPRVCVGQEERVLHETPGWGTWPQSYSLQLLPVDL